MTTKRDDFLPVVMFVAVILMLAGGAILIITLSQSNSESQTQQKILAQKSDSGVIITQQASVSDFIIENTNEYKVKIKGVIISSQYNSEATDFIKFIESHSKTEQKMLYYGFYGFYIYDEKNNEVAFIRFP